MRKFIIGRNAILRVSPECLVDAYSQLRLFDRVRICLIEIKHIPVYLPRRGLDCFGQMSHSYHQCIASIHFLIIFLDGKQCSVSTNRDYLGS